jgi:hypothetical protein
VLQHRPAVRPSARLCQGKQKNPFKPFAYDLFRAMISHSSDCGPTHLFVALRLVLNQSIAVTVCVDK